ncbi:MAG: hypothetical protein ACHQ6T_18025 [Myxococcota bacterium]
MFKHPALALLAAAAITAAAPATASAHGWHSHSWHGSSWHGHSDWHAHGFAPFVRVGIPLPIPVAYGPRPYYVAPPCAQGVYAPPVYPGYYAPGYYAPRVYAPAPVIAVRTPHVAISIGGFPFPF